MMKLFLIIFIIKFTLADDESYEKFIDLLPEDEKREVLDRIARRILEDINTDVVPSQSEVEIPDEELQVHNDYVKDILREEADRINDKKKIGGSEKVDKSNDSDDESRHIDLTLRTGKRLKRKNVDQDMKSEITNDTDFNVIPVKPVYDDGNEHEATNEELNENSSTAKQDFTTTSDNVDNYSDTSLHSVHYELTPQPSNDIEHTTVSTDANIDNNTDKEDYDVNSETITPQEAEEIYNTTTKEEDKKAEEDKNTGKDKKTEVIKINAVDTKENDDSDGELSTNKGEITTAIFNDISTAVSTPATVSNLEINETNEFETATDYQMKQDNTSTIERRGGLSGFNINDNISSILDTTLNDTNDLFINDSIPLTPSPIYINNTVSDIEILGTNTDNTKIEQQNTDSNLNSTTVIKSEDVESTTVDKEITSVVTVEPKQNLRLRSGAEESEESNKVLMETYVKRPERKEYEVYEVDADHPPFMLSNKDKINDQPRYVPIYDYAPEKAYFRPFDRYDPNIEDIAQENVQNYDKAIENIEKRSRFSSYNKNINRHYRIENNYPRNLGNSKMYGFMKPVNFGNQKKHYNPYDYFDIDYTNRFNGRPVLRTNEGSDHVPFPDSNESDHPYNSIHQSESVKDHVRTIKKLLYLKKIFGYVPEVNKENRKFDQQTYQTNNKKKKYFKNQDIDDIGIDYYYDRINSKEDSSNKLIEKIKLLNKRPTKYVIRNMNVETQTDSQQYIKDYDSIENINELNNITDDDNKFTSFFDSLVNVLKDNIRFNNQDLEQYDWLKTTVDIQSAITKLLHITHSLEHGEDIHPKDLELLKYSMYLFKSSKAIFRDGQRKSTGNNGHRRKKKKGILPKGNRNTNRIKQPLKLWKDFAKYLRNDFNYDDNEQKLSLLYDFEDFLQNVLFHLNEFHEAVKHVASITKFEEQNWFFDLKQIFFKKATKKQLGQIILHLSLINLLNRVEEDAVNGSEINFRQFVEDNPESISATKKKFVFLLRILKELNRLND